VSIPLLLDTQAALWWFNDDRRLSTHARRAVEHVANERFISVAAAWEMAIKVSTGKLTLPDAVGPFLREQLPPNRMTLLAVGIDDLGRVSTLPFHNRDPFDRLMAAQALERGMTIVSSDAVFEKYGAKRIW
jgi:PIN domain nuclease of toxin-antitoxin system